MEIEEGLLRLPNIEDDVSGDESGSDLSAEVCETEDVNSKPELEPVSSIPED